MVKTTAIGNKMTKELEQFFKSIELRLAQIQPRPFVLPQFSNFDNYEEQIHKDLHSRSNHYEKFSYRVPACKYYLNGYFEGDLVNSIRHGYGTVKYENGHNYNGEWKNDQRNGRGIEIFSDEGLYKGDYKDDVPDGFGQYTWANGDYYEGSFVKGCKCGKGKFSSIEGDTYSGNWNQDCFHGWGKLIWSNGDWYEGDWVHGMRSGQGMEYFSEFKDFYIGEFNNGKFNGIGKYIYGNGSEYIGNFKDGLKDGTGKVTETSFVYIGEFFEDFQKDEGIIEWKKGDQMIF